MKFPIRHRLLPALLAATILLVPLSACSTGPGDDASLPGGFAPSLQSSDESSQIADGDSATMPRAENSVIRTGDLRLSVEHPKSAANAVADTAQSFGGSVESLSVHGSGDGTTASITVRVPAEKLDAAFEALSEIGTVVSENRSAVDVTAERVDLQARVGALQTSVERLQDLMSEATTTSDLLEAESMLSERQQELDGLQAQLKSLEGQVAESTITVTLSSPNVLPGGGPGTFWEGLLAGFSSLGTFASGTLVLFGILLPWLAVAGAIALVVILIVGAERRRRRAARAATPQPATTTHPAPTTTPSTPNGPEHPEP